MRSTANISKRTRENKLNKRYSKFALVGLIGGLILTCPLFLSLASAQESRTWKDATGKFEIKATYVRVDGENVILKKEDGTNIKVPLKKLSPIDQGYVEGRRTQSGSTGQNPFEEMADDSSSKPVANNSSSSATVESGTVRTLKVNFENCPETKITKGEWDPKMPAQPPSPLKLKKINLKPKADFWEKHARSTFNVFAKRAVITHHFGRPGQQATTRMELVDLESGQSLANASGEGHWDALAIHDDGQQIVVQNVSKSDDTLGQLGTVRLQGKKIVPIDLWKPYEVMTEAPKEKVIRFAKFINNGRLLTLSQNGRVVIWDFASRNPVRRFNYHGACQPSLSNDRKYLAICGGDIFGIVNLDDENESPSVKAAPGMNYWLSSSFSPSCKRFAAATMQKLTVWDVPSGEVLFEGSIPGLSTAGKLLFPDEDFVMVNNDKLIEFSSGIKLWRYHGAAGTMVNGEMVFVHVGQDGGKIMPIAVPHAEARSMLTEAKAQSDLFILKKGAPVSLDLGGIPRQYEREVRQSLMDNIEKMGFKYAENAPVTFKATIKGPTQEAISYHFAGNFVVNQYNSVLSIEYGGKSIWSQRATNVPGAVSGRDQADIKRQLSEAGRKPNTKFFGGIRLPDFLQKPSADGKPQDQQMLGSSLVDGKGVN